MMAMVDGDVLLTSLRERRCVTLQELPRPRTRSLHYSAESLCDDGGGGEGAQSISLFEGGCGEGG